MVSLYEWLVLKNLFLDNNRIQPLTLKQQLNFYGEKKEPFFFIINYDTTQFEVIPLKKLPKNIRFQISEKITTKKHNHSLKKIESDFQEYKNKFIQLQKEIKDGNTYLANLTTTTQIKSDLSLVEIYDIANAKFKLNYKNKFICFSPEKFCTIKNDTIFTYPMKGTIDANVPNAKSIIIEDEKELAEHTMIVDLLRNDLSIICKKVTVEKFRYIDTINAGDKKLLQVSSKISGKLEKNWESNIGDIITSILPAGSITGTPKRKTVQILESIEEYERGYFTGVFGVYDGVTLQSAVMIRFIEKDEDGNLIYKSGGGITCDSDLHKEYQEMCDKVYIP
ncbi:MAG: aminodeoxychorismate synthase component I [Arcobacteraceae bacterium]